MKKKIAVLSTLTLAGLLMTVTLAAQKRINFKPGTTSATVSGTIGVNRGVAGANYRSFVLRAGAGQTISATLSSDNGKVAFVENDQTSYTLHTNRARDYTLRIYNGGANTTHYTITVSIQ